MSSFSSSSFAKHLLRAETNKTTGESDLNAQANFNSNWANEKGVWLTALVLIGSFKILFGIIPYISVELSWTLTNISYNLVLFSNLGHILTFSSMVWNSF
eukprot:NODE_23_length_38171_cov_0.318108.p23 type:complete len:100 gc:universal NODE_23_length_38171_cov_0.318108:27910-28209(+)